MGEADEEEEEEKKEEDWVATFLPVEEAEELWVLEEEDGDDTRRLL